MISILNFECQTFIR